MSAKGSFTPSALESQPRRSQARFFDLTDEPQSAIALGAESMPNRCNKVRVGIGRMANSKALRT